ncbi:MAG: STAS domain-containing protein [Candidatus Eremiobacteraeota bacterium]|nr:STAS domain-containing protein [Candidatus Eremiobacteraeota bacterium]
MAVLREVDGIPVIEVRGEVDLVNVHEFEALLHEAAEKDAGAVIVSLEGATYFDSAMIHRLLIFRRQLSVNRQTFVLIKPTLQAAQRLLVITGLTGKHEMCSSLDEGLAMASQAVLERSQS